MRGNWRSLGNGLLILGIGFASGCGQTEHAPQAAVSAKQQPVSPEKAWANAVEEVRSGESEEIRLYKNPVADAQLEELAGLTKLKRINLADSQISDEGLALIAKHAPQLELLRIGSPNISDAGMAHVAEMKKLRFLHLIDVPITDAGLKPLAAMTWLESFYLDGGKATDEGLSELILAIPKLHFHRDQQHLPNDPRKDKH
ncbi:MAG: hypothetical protein ACO1RA_13170 [Planctomycetaceae bacterium]